MKQNEIIYSIDMGGGKSQCVILEQISPTLTCTHYGEPAVVIIDETDNADRKEIL